MPEFNGVQHVADLLKAVVDGTRGSVKARRRVYDSLQALERGRWDAVAWRRVMEDVPALVYEGDGFKVDGSPQTILATIQYVIHVYLDAVDNSRLPMLSTQEAADYLGISYPMMKQYIYQTEGVDLPSEKRGQMLFFRRRDLFEFDKARRGRGRPVSEESDNA